MDDPLVFKIFRRDEFLAAVRDGRFDGSGDDRRDGFIHLSAAAQLAGSLAKHFADERSVTLSAFQAARLGAALRWEPSRGGVLFPHFHGVLDLDLAVWHRPTERGADGVWRLPMLDLAAPPP